MVMVSISNRLLIFIIIRRSNDILPPAPNQQIYESKNPFPKDKMENIGVQSFRGYQILYLKLQPVEYIPATGDLYYYDKLTVKVKTRDAAKTQTLYRGFDEDNQSIISRVDNPEAALSYPARSNKLDKSYDMLIISTPTLAAFFQPLKDYHDSTGILTEIYTTDDVGSSSPSDIRDFIREKYLSDGISYVLIGADDDLNTRPWTCTLKPGAAAMLNMICPPISITPALMEPTIMTWIHFGGNPLMVITDKVSI